MVKVPKIGREEIDKTLNRGHNCRMIRFSWQLLEQAVFGGPKSITLEISSNYFPIAF